MPRRKPSARSGPARRIIRKPARGQQSANSSSVTTWNTIDDIPLEAEDRCEFNISTLHPVAHSLCLVQLNRDKILLQDEADADSDDDGQEEVFPLKYMPPSSDSGESGDDDENEEIQNNTVSSKESHLAVVDSAKLTTSHPQNDSEDEDDSEDDSGWGKKKSAYYSTNAGEIASDDEETNELFLRESVRLQAIARSRLTEEDFGLSDYIFLGDTWQENAQ